MERKEGLRNIVSRRDFIAGLGAAGLALMAGCSYRKERQPTPPSLERSTPTPLPVSTPYSANVASLLYATATAVAENGNNSSFVETSSFDKKFFEAARRYTAVIDARRENGGLNRGTAFFFGQTEQSYYLITAQHLFEQDGVKIPVYGLTLRNIVGQTRSIDLTVEQYSYVSGGPDVAIIQCKGNSPMGSLPVTHAQDRYSPSLNEEMLVVGFPNEFEKREKQAEFVAMGSTMKVLNLLDDVKGVNRWSLNGIVDHGSSGSPVLVKDTDGTPKFVGLVYARNNNGLTICTGLNALYLRDNLMKSIPN